MRTHGSPSTPAVRELVTRARDGELLAWHTLFRQFRSELLRECVGRIPRDLRSRFDPEDVIQSAFLSAFEHIRDFEYRGEGSFRAWLRCILDNALRDGIKHHCRAMRSPSLEKSSEADGSDYLPARHLDRPDERMGEIEDQKRVLLAIRHLPDSLREVVELRVESGLTWNEIAFQLDCSATTARRRVQTALELIQHELHSSR